MTLDRTHIYRPTITDDADLAHIQDVVDGINALKVNAADMNDGKFTSDTLTIKDDASVAADRSLVFKLTSSLSRIFKYKQSTGRMRLEDQDGALVGLEVADPTADTMAMTKGYYDANFGIKSFPMGNLSGLTLTNNGTDANNDIDIAVGSCKDDTDAMNIVLGSALTKRSDAAWAVGSGNGGMDTGTKPNSGTLHVWMIKRSDTGVVDALFSTSATSPTMPADYDYKRRIGAVRTNGSGNILGFVQYGDTFLYNTVPALDVDVTNQGTTAVTRTLSVPAGIVVKALLNVVFANGSAAQASVYIKSPDLTDTAPSSLATPLGTFITENNSATADYSGGTLEVYTNTSGQVTSRATTTGLILRIATRGWIDRRGKD